MMKMIAKVFKLLGKKQKKYQATPTEKVIRVVIDKKFRCPTPSFVDKLQELVESQVSKSESDVTLHVLHRDEPTNVNHVGFDLHPWVKLKLLQMVLDWTGELDLITLNARYAGETELSKHTKAMIGELSPKEKEILDRRFKRA